MTPSIIPLSFAALLLSALSASADPVHIGLARRATSRNATYYAQAAEHLRGKYGFPSSASVSPRGVHGVIKRASTAGIPIINQNQDSSYLGVVSIGTPWVPFVFFASGQSWGRNLSLPQQFQVVLDTGSADLWVADSSCTSCQGTPVYDASQSSSNQATTGTNSQTQIRYGSGQVSGTIASETVSMGGFTMQSQKFLQADQLSRSLIDGSLSGIMGLAFAGIASTDATPFWQALSDSGQLAAKQMSFWLTRLQNAQGASDNAFGGVFTLGGTNSSLFIGDIDFVNMPGSQRTFWLLSMSGVTVQGQKVDISTGVNSLAAIDTGTTLIGGPSDDVQSIWNAVPGSQEIGSQMPGFWSFPCDTQVSVTMAFGGKAWPINPADMNLGPVNRAGTMCLGGIFDLSLGSNIEAGSGNPSWVVGDTFLKNVYSVFSADPPQIGFAQLSDAAGGSGQPSSSMAMSVHSSGGMSAIFMSLTLTGILSVILGLL